MTANVCVSVHLRGDDPVRAEFCRGGEAGPFATVRIAGSNLADGVDLFVISTAQADSLIRAAVAAKDMLIAEQVKS